MTGYLLLTITLLIFSNIFMTLAWYGHLRFATSPLWLAVLASWGIAFFEYCLQVPANRIGYHGLSAYHLKTIQEVITITVFVVFAQFYLAEGFKPKHLVGFALLGVAPGLCFRTNTGWSGNSAIFLMIRADAEWDCRFPSLIIRSPFASVSHHRVSTGRFTGSLDANY
jgi:uncharacterized protein (DUF486 family)